MRYPTALRIGCLCTLLAGPMYAADNTDSTPTANQPADATAQADTQASQPTSFWDDMAQREYLLGDAWGARPTLEELGLSLDISFAMNIAGNAVGGNNQGVTQVNSTGVNFGVDFEKLADVDGLTFFASMAYRSGTSLTQRHIHNIVSVQQLYGNQTYRLVNLYAQQTFLNDTMAIKAGRIAQFDDFSITPSFSFYMNNGFDGQPVGFFFMGPFTAYPVTTWGALVSGGAATGDQDGFYGKLGAYGADSDLGNPDNHGTNFSFNFDQGANIMGEIGYKRNWTDDTTGHPGKYSIGGWVFTGPFQKNLGGTTDNIGGIYYMFEQNVFREGRNMAEPNSTRLEDRQVWGSDQSFMDVVQGLYVWSSGQLNLSDEAYQSDFFVSGGAYYRGLFPGRDQDILAFGAAWLNFSDSYSQSQQSIGQGAPDYELELELGYRYQVTEYFYVQPNIQGIINPGGTHQLDDALVIGLQLQVDF
ncbi:MAG: carbohydrate porin [Puniceicoccales bacterium]